MRGGGGGGRERPVCQPTWKKRGVQDFVLAHIPKPFFGVLIDCGVLAFPVEVKKRIVWTHCMSGGGGGGGGDMEKCCSRLC